MFENLNTRSNGAPEAGGPANGRWATERRLAIVRAAAQVFRERGFAATGMREIAKAAGISTPSLYYYFAGKDELIYFCQDHALDKLLEGARAALKSKAAPPEKLRLVIVAQVRCMLEELDGAAAHVEVDSLPEQLRAPIVRKRDEYEKAVRRLIAAGMRTGAFQAGDPTLVTRAILGAVNWTARWYRPDGAQTPEAVASVYSEYLVRGLLP